MAQVNSQSLIPAPVQGPESPETVTAASLITPSKKKVAKKAEACSALKLVVAEFQARTDKGEILSSEEEMMLKIALNSIANQEKIAADAAAAEKAKAEADAKAKADKVAEAKALKAKAELQKKFEQTREKYDVLVKAVDGYVLSSQEALEKIQQLAAELSSLLIAYNETRTLEENEANLKLIRETIINLTKQLAHCFELTVKLAATELTGARFQPPKASKPTATAAAVAPALVEESIAVSSSGSSASSIPDETAPMNVDLPPITDSLGDVEVKTSEEEVVQPWAESDHEEVPVVESAAAEEASAESASGKRKASQGKGKSSRARRGAK